MSRLKPSGLSAPTEAMIASEFDSVGRAEMSSFHGLSGGKICMACTTRSASGVSNRIGVAIGGRTATNAATASILFIVFEQGGASVAPP